MLAWGGDIGAGVVLLHDEARPTDCDTDGVVEDGGESGNATATLSLACPVH